MAVETKRPSLGQIVRTATDQFRAFPDYRDGDLVNRQQVASVLDAIAKLGWEVPGRDQIEQRTLANGSFLARELSTPAGKKFMRKLAQTPGTFERLDRLSSISGGQTTIRDLVRQPGGDQLVEYMATTSGGRNLGQMMARTSNGVDLNKPTGRIYTAKDFLSALAKAYRESAP